MPEMTARAPEPDTSRVPRRGGESGPPPITVNDATRRAMERQQERQGQAAAPAPVEPPPDPEVEMAKPLDALPKWESEHTFVLSHPVQRMNGGGEVREVKLRGPQGLDMFEVGGLPTKTMWNPGGMTVEMDPERLRKWLSRLSVDVDLPTLYRAPARDIRAMFEWLNTELQQAGN